MSVELHVHAPGAPLSPALLVADSAAINWHLAVLRDFESLEPAPAVADCVILGWEDDADATPALKARDRGRLETLYREEALALVELRAEHPYAADPGDLADWKRAGLPEGQLRRVRAARTRYTLRTAASRNELSAELQTQLWLLIGVLTGGLCEDPEQAEFVDPEAEEADGPAP
jgi:hypothetical protein